MAEVILNRVDHANYPDSVCDVVNEGTGRRFACQFTYYLRRPSRRGWRMRGRSTGLGHIARIMLDGAPRDLTGGATHYHADWGGGSISALVRASTPRTAEYGVHVFYRQQYLKTPPPASRFRRRP